MKVNRVHIKNFKSIVDLSLDLGPVNVFIGENGSGKSNILEALAFAAAAASNKLDNEFLVSRGIRVTDPRFMRSAFAETSEEAVSIFVEDSRGGGATFEINTSRDTSYPKWSVEPTMSVPPGWLPLPSRDQATKLLSEVSSAKNQPGLADLEAFFKDALKHVTDANPPIPITQDSKNIYLAFFHYISSLASRQYEESSLADFIIYSPEISALRTFEREGQILPLGIRGEGLLKLLRVLASEDQEGWAVVQSNLGLLDWFSGIEVDHDSSLPEQSIRLRDRFMAAAQPAFDQRSANEGFLYLLFFFALIVSKATPRFFARHGDQGSRHQPDRARQIDVGRREERPDETLQWACVIRCAVGATDRGNPSLRRAQTWRTMAKGRWQ